MEQSIIHTSPSSLLNITLGFLIAAAVITLSIVTYNTLSFYWLIPRRIKKRMEEQGVRGPTQRPIHGNLPEISQLISSSTRHDMPCVDCHDVVPRLLPHYLLWSKQYGKRFVFWNGFEPRMCLTEPGMIKELLGKYSSLSGKSWLQREGSKNFIGRGLLMANGQDWHRQRHLVAPAFYGDKLKNYAVYMVECTKAMIESIINDSCNKKEVEIGEQMSRLTADIISRVEFGSSYEKGKKIFELLTILQGRCAQASRHLCLPGSRFFPTKYNKDIKAMKLEVERLLIEIIETRKGFTEIGRIDSYGNDLLGILLNEMLLNGHHQNSAAGAGARAREGLNLQLIMDECKTFFFAGHETVALLLTWTVMLLASNLNWQDRVREEVYQVCGGAGGSPGVDQLSKLTLLNMVINESMRLYPPASILPRMAFEDINLGDLLIPKGLSIWIPVLAIHHDKDIWGDDADRFNPERFTSKSHHLSAGRFFPFGGGPRNCIGQSFAMMEAKIILAMLLSRFRFTLSENYRHAPVVVLTIKPKYGVQVCLEPLAVN